MASVIVKTLQALATATLNFALPARCAACGTIVADVHSFCSGCWKEIDFIGKGGCVRCGLPLAGIEANECAACIAQPPRLDRMQAAVAYDDVTRRLALRLKYGRKIAVARTMARYMAPLLDEVASNRVLMPVPLHRGRLWQRGFNQSTLIARELGRTLALPVVHSLRRTRRTPPLKGLSPLQRRRTVAGAFKVLEREQVRGKTVILVDDVLTTGSTANACARELRRAGAARVELVSFARVVRPAQLMR